MPIYPPCKSYPGYGNCDRSDQCEQARGGRVCRALSGHPLLKAVVLDAINSWKFVKADSPYSGYLSIKGTWQLVAPDGTINEKEQK